MDINIDRQNGVPLYMQVKKQIMDQIKNGSLKVGYKMPTERELSEKLKISRNTVSTAYKELEQEGVLKSYQGKGTFVAEVSSLWNAENIKEKIIKFVDLGFEEALTTGMGLDEFLEIVVQRVKEKKELMSRITAVYVECNIEQAKMFSKQLSSSINMNVVPLTIGDLKNMDKNSQKILEQSQVIIATFNHVNEVNKLIGNYEKEVLGVAINPDLETIVKIARYPQETKFGFFCISEEFKFKIQAALEQAGLGNINITYTNTYDNGEIEDLIDNSDVLIASPGRYSEIKNISKGKNEIVNFIYSLDDGSVNALKSKIIDIRYKK